MKFSKDVGICYAFVYSPVQQAMYMTYEGVKKVCGPTMKEHRYKGHSMYENASSQYKNTYQEKSSGLFVLLTHPP